jgi:hypothetical protein
VAAQRRCWAPSCWPHQLLLRCCAAQLLLAPVRELREGVRLPPLLLLLLLLLLLPLPVPELLML